MRRIVVVTVMFFFVGGMAAAGETVRQREQREAFQKQLEIRLNEVNQKLSSIGSRGSDVKEEYKEEFKRQAEEMQKKQEFVQRKMGDLRSASGQDWERLKAEASAAIDDLNGIYVRMSSLPKRM